MNLDEIREHWEQAARDFPRSSIVTPTSRDPFLGRLEQENIVPHLRGRSSALDIGCGDGAHTLRYAKEVGQVLGVDVSGGLVEIARERARTEGVTNAEFRVGSVLELSGLVGEGVVDCIVSQRCLINLPDWKTQQQGLRELVRVLAPGGLLLLSEGFSDELEHLNGLRAALGLEPISVVSYNHNLSRPALERFVDELGLTIAATADYGLYLVLSRVFHPLAVLPEPPQHDSPLNRAAYELAQALVTPHLREYSYNLFYALQKR